MRELMDLLISPWSFAMVLVVFGLIPNVVIRLVALFYPRGHPRRAELIAELYAVPHRNRPLWVLDQVWLGVGEGLRLRREDRRAKNRNRARRRTSQVVLDLVYEMNDATIGSIVMSQMKARGVGPEAADAVVQAVLRPDHSAERPRGVRYREAVAWRDRVVDEEFQRVKTDPKPSTSG